MSLWASKHVIMTLPLRWILWVYPIIWRLLILYVRHHKQWQRRIRLILLVLSFDWSLMHPHLDWWGNQVSNHILLLHYRFRLLRRPSSARYGTVLVVSRPLSHPSMVRLIVSLDLQRRTLWHLSTQTASTILIWRNQIPFLIGWVLLLLLLLSISRLFRLSIIIIGFRSSLHLLYQTSEQLLELLVFLPHIYYLALDPLYPLSVTPYLVLNLDYLLENYLSNLIKTLHVCLLRLVLLESKLALDLAVCLV